MKYAFCIIHFYYKIKLIFLKNLNDSFISVVEFCLGDSSILRSVFNDFMQNEVKNIGRIL